MIMNKSLGQKLRELREQRGWTQIYAARIFGITNGALSNYERDERMPDAKMLKKFAEVYEVSLDYLMDNDTPTAANGKTSSTITSENITDNIDVRLNEKDKRDIAKELEKLINDIEHSECLFAYKKQLTEGQKELLRQALEMGLKVIKLRNKEK